MDKRLSEITPEDITRAHKAIEDELVQLRDDRMWLWVGGRPPGNGLVIRERDGSDSATIRLPTRMAIEIALRALAAGSPGDREDGLDVEALAEAIHRRLRHIVVDWRECGECPCYVLADLPVREDTATRGWLAIEAAARALVEEWDTHLYGQGTEKALALRATAEAAAGEEGS